jgi:hypothetical protein
MSRKIAIGRGWQVKDGKLVLRPAHRPRSSTGRRREISLDVASVSLVGPPR